MTSNTSRIDDAQLAEQASEDDDAQKSRPQHDRASGTRSDAERMTHSTPRLDDAQIAQLAEQASVDPRSIVRRLAGLPVKGKAGDRIDRALAQFHAGADSKHAA